MKKIVFLFCVIVITSCNIVKSEPPISPMVLEYKDFGPPVIANNLIGMDWWQWQRHGDSRPSTYDIKVVVYKNTSLEYVKKNYPVVPKEEKDYRYVQYSEAIKYLDEHININLIVIVTSRLKNTKIKIIEFFK